MIIELHYMRKFILSFLLFFFTSLNFYVQIKNPNEEYIDSKLEELSANGTISEKEKALFTDRFYSSYFVGV